MNTRLLIGISVGDPEGIGPEITVKALARPEIHAVCRPLVVADLKVMQATARFSDVAMTMNAVSAPRQRRYEAGVLDVLDLNNMELAALEYKKVSARCGKPAYEYIAKVIELALAREIDATVTGPIHKEAIHAAGVHYAGHTEIYGALTKTKDYAMMLGGRKSSRGPLLNPCLHPGSDQPRQTTAHLACD